MGCSGGLWPPQFFARGRRLVSAVENLEDAGIFNLNAKTRNVRDDRQHVSALRSARSFAQNGS
jgi:hypothetical protein